TYFSSICSICIYSRTTGSQRDTSGVMPSFSVYVPLSYTPPENIRNNTRKRHRPNTKNTRQYRIPMNAILTYKLQSSLVSFGILLWINELKLLRRHIDPYVHAVVPCNINTFPLLSSS